LVIEMREYGTKRQEEFALLPAGSNLPLQDALSGLIALGYKPQEASKALSKLSVSEHADSAELIRLVLKNMMKA
ncbi:MAG: Holliday junction branch migration protein RuvA, partial [Gammaproteobacteria bacterium]